MNMHEFIRFNGPFRDLRFVDHGGYQSRHANTISFMFKALAFYAADLAGLSFDFLIYTGDNPETIENQGLPVLAFSTTDRTPNVIPIPDHIFGGWPEAGIESFGSCAIDMGNAGIMSPIIDKAFWIGCPATHPSRHKLIEIGNQNQDDMCFLGMNWYDTFTGRKQDTTQFVTLPNHCAYSMLVDIRGNGYSGRQKLLFHARRPLFIVDSPFREFYHKDLVPFLHYIPIKEDLSDLAHYVNLVKRDASS